MGSWTRYSRWLHKTFVEPLVRSVNPPWHDARAVSLGLIVGFLVPLGGHLVTLALLRLFLRFSYVIAAAFTVVNNPLNIIPLYYGYYCLGSYILGRPIAMDFRIFQKLMNPVMDKTYFWEAFAAFMNLGREILVRWLVAAVIVAVVFGIIGYVVTFKVQKNRCKRAAEKLGMKYEQFVEDLERNVRSGKI